MAENVQDFEGLLQAFLVDLNGDGVPDAQVQAPAITNRDRGAIQRRAMAGREPSPLDQARLAADMPRLEANSNRLASITNIPQTVTALGEAYQDPSIPNVTNAATNVLLTGFRPGMALGALGAGYGAAALQETGLIPSARANPRDRERTKAAKAETTASRAKADEARARADEARITADAEIRRRQAETEAADKESKRIEFDNAVSRADMAKKTILADKPRKFSETIPGQVYEKTGIVTPFLAAAGLGGLSRLASGGGTVAKDYLIPGATGLATGAVAANYPLGHDLIFQPPGNTERKAYEAYARELPPDHPRKAEWQTYAQGMPTENPDREAASKEFYDPVKFAERTAIGAVEGVLGGLGGSEVIRTGRRAYNGLTGGSKGAADNTLSGPVGTPQGGQPNLLGGTQGRYPAVGTPERQYIRDTYADDVLSAGATPVPSRASRAIQQDAADQGGRLPNMTGRVQETNAAVQQFVAQHGRLPRSRQEWDQFIFRNTRTLAVPLAAGAGYNALIPNEQ